MSAATQQVTDSTVTARSHHDCSRLRLSARLGGASVCAMLTAAPPAPCGYCGNEPLRPQSCFHLATYSSRTLSASSGESFAESVLFSAGASGKSGCGTSLRAELHPMALT